MGNIFEVTSVWKLSRGDKMKQCPQCGASVEKDAHTCQNCGQSIKSENKHKSKQNNSKQHENNTNQSSDKTTNIKIRKIVPVAIVFLLSSYWSFYFSF